MHEQPIHLDFMILGTQKAGTTSVHDWLVEGLSVNLPVTKETHFFSHDRKFEKGVKWYESQFKESEKEQIKGEVDPEYLFSRNAATRICDYTDTTKFIVILRQPLKRAFSQYLMSVRRGFEDLPFDKALLEEKKRLETCKTGFSLDHHSYLSRGLYSRQIEVYKNIFPQADFLFVKFEDMTNQAKMVDVYRDICSFIGLPFDVQLMAKVKRSNQASTPRLKWLRNIIYRKGNKSLVRKFLSKLLPDGAKLRLAMSLDKLNQKKINKTDLKPLEDYKIDDCIRAYILSDINKTEVITGLCLDSWK